MHDNLQASKTVKDSKSMVFFIPMVNRKNYSSLAMKRLSLLILIFINTVLLLLDVKLLVYGEK